ncbi:hypothetical protein OPV22_009231 [Ensete ventricosum]|uniref:L-lactate dehydrogenase n=1 Tax=Ensete ventricosum TaxID=4639 RepID=A0AAV8RAA3_ENSVE|nr:hypothetical protein OPV22_009231 [Ensete ventricosum]
MDDAQHVSLDGSAEAHCGLEVDEPVDEGAAGLLGWLARLGVDEAVEDVGAHAELKSKRRRQEKAWVASWAVKLWHVSLVESIVGNPRELLWICALFERHTQLRSHGCFDPKLTSFPFLPIKWASAGAKADHRSLASIRSQSEKMKKVSSLAELGFADDVHRALFRPIQQAEPPSPTKRHTKISVIGAGNVGMAIAQTILTQDLTDELALVDAKPDKLRGEMLDLQHAAAFLPRTRILASPDYAVTVDSDICIITAGARQIPGETRLNLLQRNLSLFKEIVPPLARYSPGTLLLVVSNPVDVLTYIAWKLSGFPPNRVIGSGTNLDSSRFRFLLADHLEVNAQDVQAYMVGEHGDSSVALWSSISVGGVPILSQFTKDVAAIEQGVLERIRKAVVDSAYEVIRLKGYTSWAIGYSVASLARSLLRDQHRIHPVSLLANGFYGIPDDRDVFLSLPAQLGRSGILTVANIQLTDEEAGRLRRSADALWDLQQKLDL